MRRPADSSRSVELQPILVFPFVSGLTAIIRKLRQLSLVVVYLELDRHNGRETMSRSSCRKWMAADYPSLASHRVAHVYVPFGCHQVRLLRRLVMTQASVKGTTTADAW
jgi:hypothetical protein